MIDGEWKRAVSVHSSGSKAPVMVRDKDRTKSSTNRLIEPARALQALKRHLALRAQLQLAGKIQRKALFFKETGEPIRNPQYPWVRCKRSTNFHEPPLERRS